ncbi:sugar ABC transporter substrate-binding protein [Microbacterium sp. NPDC077184]|uniref:sugar ABC transporter substrate-binding protein n=1 Tax=Microbacterium sp. NPDC077184 TaxID=3154764 RepID=UPI00342DED79
MRKNTSAIAAALAAVALLVSGCSSAAPGGGGGEEESKGAIAFSFPTQDVNIWKQQLDLLQPRIEEAGYTFLTDNPSFDLQTQVNDWTTWVQRGDVKAIMGFPVQADAMVPVTAQATAANIPVLGYAGAWEGVTAQLILDTVDAGSQVGEAAGEWIKENAGGEQVRVAILADTTADLGRSQKEGIEKGLEASGADVVIDDLEASSRDDGYKAAQTQLVAHPDTTVWLGIGADMVLGARQAVIDSGVAANDPSYYVSATDGDDEAFGLIASGDDMWRTAFVWTPESLVDAEFEMLIAAAEGREVEDVTLGVTEVNADNAASLISK